MYIYIFLTDDETRVLLASHKDDYIIGSWINVRFTV